MCVGALIQGVFGAFGNMYEAGVVQPLENDIRRKQAAENMRLAELAAVDARARGAQEAGLARMAGSKLVAEQHVAYATSGVDATVGTPAQVMADTKAMAELEALTIKNNAAREAWGYEVKRDQLFTQEKFDRRMENVRNTKTLLGG